MTAFTITEHRSGLSFNCVQQQSLLVAMERSGRHLIDIGCRGGGCGRCRIKVITGNYISKKMSRKHISRDDETQNVVLACKVYPKSDITFETMPSACNATPTHYR